MSTVIALIPAHNEAEQIGDTIFSLLDQTVMPSRIIVAADNCTDGTEAVARALGAEVFVTVDNTDKKAGALNQALASLQYTLSQDDIVLVMDADTKMVPAFVATGLKRLEAEARVGAVGGIFLGEGASTLLEQLQCNEYARYGEEIERTGRVMVLTGTAAMIRVAALRDVAVSRGARLPGVTGDVYDRNALTEDNELTLALKTLGWTLESPSECLTETELMPSWTALHRQRVRWYRGALDNLVEYGLTRVTFRYWRQQTMLALGTALMTLYLFLTAVDLASGSLTFNIWWTLVGLVFWSERVVTAWPAGWHGRIVAVLFIPEICYDIFLQVAFIRALSEHLRRTKTVWHHNTEKEHVYV